MYSFLRGVAQQRRHLVLRARAHAHTHALAHSHTSVARRVRVQRDRERERAHNLARSGVACTEHTRPEAQQRGVDAGRWPGTKRRWGGRGWRAVACVRVD